MCNAVVGHHFHWDYFIMLKIMDIRKPAFIL